MVDSYFEERDLTVQMNRRHESSKAKCFWKDCTKRIDPDQLFCSKTCQHKSFTFDGYSRMHQTALKFWEPESLWLTTPFADSGIWHTRMNDQQAKNRKHAMIWNESWGTMFSRYGVRKPVPPKQGGIPLVDEGVMSLLQVSKVSSPWGSSWNTRNSNALRWKSMRG